MGTRTFSVPVNDNYGETLTLGTTALGLNFLKGAEEVMVNAAGAWRMDIGPKMALCLKTTDNEATFTDYTTYATDKSTSTSVTLSSLSTAANGDYWYLASKHRFAGAILDIDSTNSTESTMSGYYWNGSAWADASITDGTKSGSTCLAADGLIYWTPSSSWTRTTLNGEPDLFVIRFQVSVAIDSSVTIDEITLVTNPTTNWGYYAASTDYVFSLDQANSGSINAMVASATPALNTTWYRHTRFNGV